MHRALRETVRTEIDLPVSVQAPVTQGEIAGTVTFYVGDRKVGETYLVWGKSAGLDVVSPDSERSPLGFLKKLAGME